MERGKARWSEVIIVSRASSHGHMCTCTFSFHDERRKRDQEISTRLLTVMQNHVSTNAMCGTSRGAAGLKSGRSLLVSPLTAAFPPIYGAQSRAGAESELCETESQGA